MKFGNSISPIQLNQHEYCIMTTAQMYNSNSIRITIPKLMTDISPMKSVYFNKNIFLNAPECRPAVDSRISLQQHITIPRSQQCSLGSRADEYGIVPAGTKLICMCMNNNVKDLRVVDVI